MTETPHEPDVTPAQDPPMPGDDKDVLRDGELPAPYPDDTPGGMQDGNTDSDTGDTADLAADAERLADE